MADSELLIQYANTLEGRVTKDSRLKIASEFLAFSQDKLERVQILAFLEQLRKGGYAPGTISNTYGVIRRLFKVNNIPFPMAPGESPVVPEEDVWAPALEPSLIVDMINVAKEGKLTPQETAFLALSTTYGLRAIEMRLLEPLDFKGATVFVHSAKGSRQRYHLIPEGIRPYLKAYDFKPRLGGFQIQTLYISIENKAEIQHSYGVGWHSIRRTLDSRLLESGLPYHLVREFLRWKSPSSDMPGRYYSARRYVGRGGVETISMMPSSKDADLVVFKSHPFLPCWEGVKDAS